MFLVFEDRPSDARQGASHTARCILVTLLCWAGVFVPAHAASTGMETLRIGPIRIMCFKAPCPPWNAMAISQGTEPAGPNPLYLGPLPSIKGSHAVKLRINKVWRNKGCLIVRARLSKSGKSARLTVERILRSC